MIPDVLQHADAARAQCGADNLPARFSRLPEASCLEANAPGKVQIASDETCRQVVGTTFSGTAPSGGIIT